MKWIEFGNGIFAAQFNFIRKCTLLIISIHQE
jgi:hypothetical protein